MRQVLWFAGGHFPLPEDRRQFPEATLDWAREHGIQTNWIDEINWLTGGNRSGPAPRWPARLSAFTWADISLLDHALLHAASHAILSGERNLVLLGEEEEDDAHVLALCSEKAAASLSLAPVAALSARFSLASDDLTAGLVSGLREVTLEQTSGLLAACDDSGRMPVDLPGGWRWLEGETSGCAVGLCNRLVEALRAGASDTGLLVSLPAQGPGMATVLERWQP